MRPCAKKKYEKNLASKVVQVSEAIGPKLYKAFPSSLPLFQYFSSSHNRELRSNEKYKLFYKFLVWEKRVSGLPSLSGPFPPKPPPERR